VREIEALVARGRNGHGPVPPPAAESLREIARRGAREAERRTLKDASRILKVSYKTLPTKSPTAGSRRRFAGNRRTHALRRIASR